MPNQGTVIGRSGGASWTMSGGAGGSQGSGGAVVDYSCILRMFEVEDNVEMIDASVFCIEGTADQEPGREQLTMRIVGVMKYGILSSGPMIPAPQNVAIVAQFAPLCTISANYNFRRATATRTVNENGILTGEAISKGPFVVLWNRSNP